MAIPTFLLQAVTKTDHASTLLDVAAKTAVDRALVSVGFANEAGVVALEDFFINHKAVTDVFIGIRNDITTLQGVTRLINIGCRVHAVDTATRQVIFHPKLYLVSGNKSATCIVGSANLTHSGLYNNIEGSAVLSLDLRSVEDREFVDDVFATFSNLPAKHPDHVFQIRDVDHVNELFEQGRLADERETKAPKATNGVRKGTRDALQPMKLRRVGKSTKITVNPPVPPAIPPGKGLSGHRLVWQSNPLSRRDLNIPSGGNTNATGSMLLKEGAFEGIDFQRYFRDSLFDELDWLRDTAPRTSHYERARCKFELIVKGLNYGVYDLGLNYNTDETSITWTQKNATTNLSWGAAKPIVAKEDLLGRTLSIYKKVGNPPEFIIEID